jgi:hypothetical protein
MTVQLVEVLGLPILDVAPSPDVELVWLPAQSRRGPYGGRSTVSNMKLDELKSKSNEKVLLRGKSGRGKTDTSCRVVVELLSRGVDVIYVDTESEGANTIVKMVENGDYSEDVVEALEYVQVSTYDALVQALERQNDFDVMVVDTLDHKHTYAIKGVTDAKRESEADWNQYPQIYSAEKQIMEMLGKPDCNVIATVDPDSGSMDKPKGAQTNVHGYFSIVVDLKKSGDEWTNQIVNWVGKGHVIGASADNLTEALVEEISDRV